VELIEKEENISSKILEVGQHEKKVEKFNYTVPDAHQKTVESDDEI
jgi:hypothetical protein